MIIIIIIIIIIVVIIIVILDMYVHYNISVTVPDWKKVSTDHLY